MKVHHLDCATMCPLGAPSVNRRGYLVGHCLLVETDRDGLVLVDTGIGTADVDDPRGRLGREFTALVRPRMGPSRTAVRQVEALGFATADVAHIVVTHLDVDHAGGLADFPEATVHVHSAELDAARRPSLRERTRYRDCQWAHGPRWQPFGTSGEEWFGFPAVRRLHGLDESILVVPMPGHTRGHVLVAVREQDRWWLHCGDAYFHEHTVDPRRPASGALLRVFEAATAMDRARVRDNHARLRELSAVHGDEVRMFCAHDPDEFERALSL